MAVGWRHRRVRVASWLPGAARRVCWRFGAIVARANQAGLIPIAFAPTKQ